MKHNPNNSERKFVVHRLSYKRVKLSQLHIYITKENLRPFIFIEQTNEISLPFFEFLQKHRMVPFFGEADFDSCFHFFIKADT